MKTKEQLLEEIKVLEQNIERGKKFAALGYNSMMLSISIAMLERAKEELIKWKEV